LSLNTIEMTYALIEHSYVTSQLDKVILPSILFLFFFKPNRKAIISPEILQ